MPMSEGIIFELQFFFSSFLLGVMMTIAYDGIRIFRRIFPHGGVIVAIEDLAYWLTCGVCIFRMLYVKNSGAIRGFAIAAVVLGMLVYLQLSKIIKKAVKKLHSWVKRGIID